MFFEVSLFQDLETDPKTIINTDHIVWFKENYLADQYQGTLLVKIGGEILIFSRPSSLEFLKMVDHEMVGRAVNKEKK
jgi:hypothetical protein